MNKIVFLIVTLIVFVIFVIIAISCLPFTLFNIHVSEATGSIPLDSFVFVLTLAVAILTILVAVIGCFEFSRVNKYTEKVDRFEKELDSKLDEFNHSQEELLEQQKNHLNDNFCRALIKQEKYYDQTLLYLSQAAYSIIEQMTDKVKVKKLIKFLTLEYHIANLYRSSIDLNETTKIDKKKKGALLYLTENATKEHISHLKYVAQNDPNEDFKNQAQIIIGQIKEREKNKRKEEMDETEQTSITHNYKSKKCRHNGKMNKRKKR